MARTSGDIVDNNFTRGLITEATNLNFPENACTDADNVRFDRVGKVRRRGGLEGEVSDPTFRSTDNNTHFKYVWENPGNQNNKTFVVIQDGKTLEIYEQTSTGTIAGTAPLFTTTLSGLIDTPISVTNVRGALIVVNKSFKPFKVLYRDSVFSTEEISIKIRDINGLDDGFGDSERPALSAGTKEHLYNLLNQGWDVGEVSKSLTDLGNTSNKNPLNNWRKVKNEWPSNSDLWWTYKDSTENFNVNFGIQETPTTLAPKGHFIINPFLVDRSDVSGVTGLSVESINTYPSLVAVFAGRVWYGGVAGTNLEQTIFFTQILKDSDSDFGKCYQVNDPTSENFFDLLKTDGGTISILEMGKIVHITTTARSLLIFASNGIWGISGSEGVGFTATDYSVELVSGIQAVSKDSFVEAQGSFLWWNYDGIYALSAQNAGTSFQVANVTEETIKTFYNDIPIDSKAKARGSYNALSNEIIWIYSSDASATEDFNKCLVMDGVSQAFSVWSFDTTNLKLKDVFLLKGTSVSVVTTNVTTSNGDNVVTIEGNVIVEQQADATQTYKTKFIATDGSTDYVLEESNLVFEDFTFNDAYRTEYTSYFTTGYRVRGSANKKTRVEHILVWTEKIAANSAFMRVLWDYPTSDLSNDWSGRQQICKNFSRQNYHNRRLKVRGTGYAVQFRFESDSTKPFCVTGWSTFETGNSNV